VNALLEKDGIEINKAANMGDKFDAGELVFYGESPIFMECSIYNGATPLFMACEEGNEVIVNALLEKEGIEINKEDIYGYTPLSVARHFGHNKIVQILKEKGAK
jgi:hypothetical protein